MAIPQPVMLKLRGRRKQPLQGSRRRDKIVLRARRAAAYAKTPTTWTPDVPTVLTIVFLFEAVAILASPRLRASRLAVVLFGSSVPIGLWLFVYWKIYLSVFTTPKTHSIPVTDDRWEKFDFLGWGEEKMVGHILRSDQSSKDLLLYLHGYDSSLGRGESRCQHIQSFGINIIGMDQRGFGTQQGRMDWTLLKVIADAEAILEAAPQQLGFTPEKLWIYGHSMGGFITIRLASHQSGWWEHALKGIILESPVSSFPKIIDEKLPGKMVMARPWVRHVLRREYERIHPDLPVRYATSELPYWGIPKVPILVVQAEDDETLGSTHFELLLEHFDNDEVDCEIHTIENMPHTSHVDRPERAKIVEDWLEAMR